MTFETGLRSPVAEAAARSSSITPVATQETPLSLLRRLLTSHLESVEQHAARIVHTEHPDAEAIHDFRIALRRAETVLRQFRPLLPRRECKWFLGRFKELRKASNPLRDADIFLEHLAAYHDDGPFNGLKERALNGHQSSLALVQEVCAGWLALDERRDHRARLLDRIDRALQKQEVEHDETDAKPLARWIDTRLKKTGRSIFRIKTKWKGWETLHERRIDAKRLRYALELYREYLPRDEYDAIYRRLKSLQNRLGTMNDEVTIGETLKEWTRSEGVPATDLEEIATLRHCEKESLSGHREEFREWWTTPRRRKWKNQWQDLLDKLAETA